MDAAEEHIRQWYVERFLLLKSTAFRNPRSYFHRFAEMADEDAQAFAIDVWERINLVNLVRNVATTRERAQVVMQKGRGPPGAGGLAEAGVGAVTENANSLGRKTSGLFALWLIRIAAIDVVVVEGFDGGVVAGEKLEELRAEGDGLLLELQVALDDEPCGCCAGGRAGRSGRPSRG